MYSKKEGFEMNKNLKRKLYALALAGFIMSGVNTRAFAESLDDVDMTPIDIEEAIIDLVPQEKNNSNSESNNNNNSGNNTNNDNNNNSNDNNSVSNGTDESIKDSNNSNTNTGNTNNQSHSGNVESNNNHVSHNYGSEPDDVINQKAPTCTTAGSYSEVYYCKDCGQAHIVDVVVEAPGHKWVNDGKRVNETSNGYYVINYCEHKGCNEKREVYVEKVTPTEPTKPSIPSKPVTPSEIPKTSDDVKIGLASCTLLGSATGLVGLAYLNNKDNSDKKYKGKYLSRK